MIAITIPGRPVGKQRPRMRRHGRAYTPAKTLAYEGLVRHEGALVMGTAPPLTGAVAMTVDVYLAVPQSWSKARRTAALAGDVRPVGRPDLDNVLKAIADGLNSVAYRDDSQIVLVQATKWYGQRDEVRIALQEVAA